MAERLPILLKIAFWTALAVATWVLVAPSGPGPGLIPWDKAEHFLGLYGLTLLAAAAFARRALWVVGAGLALYGGVMELVQALPAVHRDADLYDWAADIAGVLAATAPAALPRIRERLRERAKNAASG